jgi:hypothetical protein
MTRLDTNLTPKNKPFYILAYFIMLNLKWTQDFLFFTPKHKVDTIRTPDLHMYSHLGPMSHAANGLMS